MNGDELRSAFAWSAYRCKRVRIERPGRNNQADKVLVWGNWEGRECGRSTGKEASPNFRTAGPDAMCLRSPRAFGPPLSLSLFLSLSFCPLSPLFFFFSLYFSVPLSPTSLRVSSSLPRLFRCIFLSHMRIKTSFPRITGFTLLSTLLSFSLCLFFFLVGLYLSPASSESNWSARGPRRRGVSARIPVSGPANRIAVAASLATAVVALVSVAIDPPWMSVNPYFLGV